MNSFKPESVGLTKSEKEQKKESFEYILSNYKAMPAYETYRSLNLLLSDKKAANDKEILDMTLDLLNNFIGKKVADELYTITDKNVWEKFEHRQKVEKGMELVLAGVKKAVEWSETKQAKAA